VSSKDWEAHSAFENVIDSLELLPKELLFIDDNDINVKAARQTELIAYKAKGIEAVHAILVRHCILTT